MNRNAFWVAIYVIALFMLCGGLFGCQSYDFHQCKVESKSQVVYTIYNTVDHTEVLLVENCPV